MLNGKIQQYFSCLILIPSRHLFHSTSSVKKKTFSDRGDNKVALFARMAKYINFLKPQSTFQNGRHNFLKFMISL